MPDGIPLKPFDINGFVSPQSLYRSKKLEGEHYYALNMASNYGRGEKGGAEVSVCGAAGGEAGAVGGVVSVWDSGAAGGDLAVLRAGWGGIGEVEVGTG